MVKRCFDVLCASVALILLAPIMALTALGIRATSPGPIIYRALRAGKDNRPFILFKFRTMHVCHENRSAAITARGDSRVFAFGALLRLLKIDELPQLINVIRGDMSIVGPRPEALQIVRDHYTTRQLETLSILPGLASPGSLYNYTHGERMLNTDTPEHTYVTRLLPVKLALECVYVQDRSMTYDLLIVLRTILLILQMGLGKREFDHPPEFAKAVERGLFDPPVITKSAA